MPRTKLNSPKRAIGSVVGKTAGGSLTREQAESILNRWFESGKINAKQLKAATERLEEAKPKTDMLIWFTMSSAERRAMIDDLNNANEWCIDPPSIVAEWYDPTADYHFQMFEVEGMARKSVQWLCAVPVIGDLRLPKAAMEHLEIIFERTAAPFCFPQDVAFVRRS